MREGSAVEVLIATPPPLKIEVFLWAILGRALGRKVSHQGRIEVESESRFPIYRWYSTLQYDKGERCQLRIKRVKACFKRVKGVF